jgi:hypothetical protein
MNSGGIVNGHISAYNPYNYPFAQTPNYPKVEAHEGNPYII